VKRACCRGAGQSVECYRAQLGAFGLSGDVVLRPVAALSGGQKSRVAFTLMSMHESVTVVCVCVCVCACVRVCVHAQVSHHSVSHALRLYTEPPFVTCVLHINMYMTHPSCRPTNCIKVCNVCDI